MSGAPRPDISISREERARRRREVAVILAAGLAVVFFAVWEIGRPAGRGATGNVVSFLLVNLNIVLLLVVAFLVLRNIVKLVIDRRRRVPGSHLRGRLVFAFVTIALFPAGLMLVISYQFVTSNIDDWLDSEVEQSLEGAWELAHTYYRDSADAALAHARALAAEAVEKRLLQPSSRTKLRELVLEHQRAYKLGTIQIVNSSGEQVLALFNESTPTGMPLYPDAELMSENLEGREATKVEAYGESDVISGAVPILDSKGKVLGAVVVDYFVERSIRRWSEDILKSFSEFRQLKLSKQPFKNLYAITLALAAVAVVFSATWLGIYMARGVTDPIGRLAEATERVAGGDWEVRLEEAGGDEVGMLVSAFNTMTSQLKATHDDLDERRRYIENVLGHIEAGVVSIDEEGRIGTVNSAAVSLLGLDAEGLAGLAAVETFQEAGYSEMASLLKDLSAGVVASGTRINVKREQEGRTLLVTATELKRVSGERAGFVLFVENVSQIVEVQRMEAWREVARRIAHEIKNPLTPIQLSAQRLGRRLRSRLGGEDAELLERSVETIVSQVDTLKQLVNEFSRFAQKSEGDKRLHDLNQLVEETIPLYSESRPDIKVEFSRAEELPALMLDRQSVKRVLINLLDNAVAALSADEAVRESGVEPQIELRTSFDERTSRVVLEVADNGPGIAAKDKPRVFEPYFSTKDDGTGLGLAIVASVAADHQAFVRVRDNHPRGSRFVIEFPIVPKEREVRDA